MFILAQGHYRGASAGSPQLCEGFPPVCNPIAAQQVRQGNGHVETVRPDAAQLPDTREHVTPLSGFRTLVVLDSPYLVADGERYQLTAGMPAWAGVNPGSRTVMEYLLLPVRVRFPGVQTIMTKVE
jgi:multidrug efflux pump subunit AcrA (membrane-fusion protein)